MLLYCSILLIVMVICRILHWQAMGAFGSFIILILANDICKTHSKEMGNMWTAKVEIERFAL